MNKQLLIATLFIFLFMVVGVSLVSAIGTYPAVDPNMVLYYHFNNDSSVGENYTNSNGDLIYDYSNNINGTLINGTWNNSGGYLGDGSFNFDGINDKIYTNTGASGNVFDGTGDITISAWVYLNNLGGGGVGRILDNGKLLIFAQDDSGLRFKLHSDGNNQALTNANKFSFNEWVHIIIVRNSTGDVIFYINGIDESGYDVSSGPIVAGTTNLTIGGRIENDRQFNGSIDEVIIYNYSLSSEQIGDLYSSYIINRSLTNCSDLTIRGATYTLQNNITFNVSGSCFNISDENIVLDLNGYSINYGDNHNNYCRPIYASNVNNITIKNGNIIHLNNDEDTWGYDIPIWLEYVKDSFINNLTIYTNASASAGINGKRINNTIFSNNSITTYQSQHSHGIVLSNNSYGNIIELNQIKVDGAVSHGIRLDGLDFNSFPVENNIIRNNILNMTTSDGWGIYLKNGANNNTVYNNTVYTRDLTSYGFIISRSTENYLDNNSVYSDNGISYWMETTTSFDISLYPLSVTEMFNNTLTNRNLAHGKPINVTSYEPNLKFDGIDFTQYGQVIFINSSNLTIINSNFSDDTLTLFAMKNSNISYNRFITNNSYGIWASDYSDNNIFNNNFINVTRTNNLDAGVFSPEGTSGIHIRNVCFNNEINNNNIYTTGKGSMGIQIKDGSNFSINNNNITTYDGAMGFFMWGSDTSVFNNNFIQTNGDSILFANAIYLQTSVSTLITNNSIITNGTNARGINVFDDSYFTHIENNNIITHGTSSTLMRIDGDMGLINNTMIINNNFTGYDSSTVGFSATNRIYNVTFNNNSIFTSGTDIQLYDVTNSLFVNLIMDTNPKWIIVKVNNTYIENSDFSYILPNITSITYRGTYPMFNYTSLLNIDYNNNLGDNLTITNINLNGHKFTNINESNKGLFINSLTSALIYNTNGSIYGNSDISLNNGNINITLAPNNASYVLDNYNITEGITRANDPMSITSTTTTERTKTLHIASNITDEITVPIYQNVSNCDILSVVMTPNGKSGYIPEYSCNPSTLILSVTGNLTYSLTSNTLTVNYLYGAYTQGFCSSVPLGITDFFSAVILIFGILAIGIIVSVLFVLINVANGNEVNINIEKIFEDFPVKLVLISLFVITLIVFLYITLMGILCETI